MERRVLFGHLWAVWGHVKEEGLGGETVCLLPLLLMCICSFPPDSCHGHCVSASHCLISFPPHCGMMPTWDCDGDISVRCQLVRCHLRWKLYRQRHWQAVALKIIQFLGGGSDVGHLEPKEASVFVAPPFEDNDKGFLWKFFSFWVGFLMRVLRD